MNGTISIHKRDFVRAQYGIITALLVLSLLLYLYDGFGGHDLIVRGLGVFDVDREDSVPSWFSAFNLMLAACLLLSRFVVSQVNLEKGSRYWLLLGLIFVALSIDEVAGFHERSAQLSAALFSMFTTEAGSPNSKESLHWLLINWNVFGFIFVLAVLLFFLPFLRMLPKRTAGLFVLAGAIFVGGALGFEIIGDWTYAAGIAQYHDLRDNIRILIEEAGEMYGIAIFNCVLFTELTKGNRILTLQLGSPR